MDTRFPAPTRPGGHIVAGHFDGEGLQAEINRAAVANAFSSVGMQILIILAACLGMAVTLMLGVDQMKAYDAALACAGV
ncbi:hypothetical protein [Mesorhizobium sp. CAU 1741]|uniref:hypothetical protein n=1 Tax=Mesorhizobium sp. CAU 1741 TaxID=3140366 RepID=UPI00325BD974